MLSKVESVIDKEENGNITGWIACESLNVAWGIGFEQFKFVCSNCYVMCWTQKHLLTIFEMVIKVSTKFKLFTRFYLNVAVGIIVTICVKWQHFINFHFEYVAQPFLHQPNMFCLRTVWIPLDLNVLWNGERKKHCFCHNSSD